VALSAQVEQNPPVDGKRFSGEQYAASSGALAHCPCLGRRAGPPGDV